MEALIGLLLIIGILGGGFLLLCVISFVIAWLLSFIDGGNSDWIWSSDIYGKDKKDK